MTNDIFEFYKNTAIFIFYPQWVLQNEIDWKDKYLNNEYLPRPFRALFKLIIIHMNREKYVQMIPYIFSEV